MSKFIKKIIEGSKYLKQIETFELDRDELFDLISTTLYLVYMESDSNWESLVKNLEKERNFERIDEQRFRYLFVKSAVFLKLVRIGSDYKIQISVDQEFEHIILEHIIKT